MTNRNHLVTWLSNDGGIPARGLTSYSKKLVFLMCVFMILDTVPQLFY